MALSLLRLKQRGKHVLQLQRLSDQAPLVVHWMRGPACGAGLEPALGRFHMSWDN